AGGKWSAFVLAAAVAAGQNSRRGGGFAISARLAWRGRECALVTRVVGHPAVGGGGRWAGGSAPEQRCGGGRGARARVRAWGAGPGPPVPAVGGQIPHRPCHAGISAMTAARSSGWRGRGLGWVAHPGRSDGNDHGRFRSHFGVQVFEKPVGTAGFEPATP